MEKILQTKNGFPEEINFSNHKYFPGVQGNPFDVILKGLTRINEIPWPIFLILLLLLAWLSSGFNGVTAAIFLCFFILDWLFLSALPKKLISFGPPQPPVLFLAILRSFFVWTPFWLFLPLQITGTILVFYGFFLEPHKIKVSQEILSSPKLKKGSKLRLLHLGDLHIERISRREIQLNQMINSLAPDIILFSGDIINLSYTLDKQSWKDAQTIISEWKAPLGTYLVSGSPAVDLPEIMNELLSECSINWLNQEYVSIKQDGNVFDIYGINCTHQPHIDGKILNSLLQDTESHFSILLYHSPDLAPIAARHKIDLQLSGHTHGGQVRLPWFGALFTGSLYGKSFESGRYELNNTTLYITRGIGLEGAGAPRVRFLCPPEITLWEITST